VQPLYITVDPECDTWEVLRAFLREQDPRFIGVTGSREQIDNAKRAFRVFAQRRDEGAGDVEPSVGGMPGCAWRITEFPQFWNNNDNHFIIALIETLWL
jgi:cytochrome oxidase Cu insertion factor (SCO1/SenC/PrrC family)